MTARGQRPNAQPASHLNVDFAFHNSRRVRSGVQRRIYHLRRPSTSPPLRSSASAPSLRSGYVTPDSAVQRERAARAAEREAERAQDAAMERARRMTVAELADKLRRGAAI